MKLSETPGEMSAPAPAPKTMKLSEVSDDGVESEPKSFLSTAMEPFKRYPGAVKEAYQAGTEQAKSGFEKISERPEEQISIKKPLGVGQILLGGLEQASSPITGAAKVFAQEPTEKAATAVGAPPFVSKSLGYLAGDAASFAGPSVVAKSATAISDLLPGYTNSVKKLIDAGVKLTPGQIAQGMVKRAEDSFSSIPVLGDIMKSAQYRSLQDFNTAVINRSLKEIGTSLPKNIEQGRKSIAFAERTIGDKYDKLLPKLTFAPDQQFIADSAKIENANIKNLPQNLRGQWDRIWDDATDRLSQGKIDGRDFKEIDSELGYKYREYSRSQDPAQRAFADSIYDLRAAMRANLERANPKFQGELNKLNTAWAMFSRVQAASINRVKSGGVFSPGDLLSAIKRQSTRGEFARGDGLLQDLADAGNEVLPSVVPDSGTVRRALMAEGALTGGSVLAHHPELAIATVGASLPYTRPGIRGINALAKGIPATAATANDVLRSLPAGIGATVGAQPTIQGDNK